MEIQSMTTKELNKLVKAAERHSEQAPDRIVSVYQTRVIGSGLYMWAGIRFDESRNVIENNGHISALYKTFFGGEEIAV